MKTRFVAALPMLGVACPITPVVAQTPAQDVTAAMQGELATQVLESCNSELSQYCAEVEVGGGRVAQCLKDHAAELSPGCDQALTDVGVQ
jgi:hypothetical protein